MAYIAYRMHGYVSIPVLSKKGMIAVLQKLHLLIAHEMADKDRRNHVTLWILSIQGHCRAEVSIGAEKTILKCRTSAAVVLSLVMGSGATRMDERVAGIL